MNNDNYNQLIQKLHDIQVLKDNKCYSGSRKNLDKHPTVKQLLWDLTAFGNINDDYQIRIMYIMNNLTELPKCKTCSGPVGPSKVYTQRGTFAEYCSRSCVNYTNNQTKSKQTCIEKYGVDNPAKSQAAIEKAKQTNRERYGADYAQQTEEGKNKITKTMQERYGVDRPLQSSEFKQKAIQTNIERYGTHNPALNADVVAKKKQTCLERYGVENVFSCDTFKERIKQTCLERYGVENPATSDEIKQRHKQTCLERYGVENASKRNHDVGALAVLADPEQLRYMHHDLKWSHAKIAKELNTTQPCISRYFSEYGIEVKYFQSSQGERDLNDFITTLSFETVPNTRSLIPPFEIDIYVPSCNLALEYNGSYWHNTEKRPDTYHLNKTLRCEQIGIQLIHIHENEWIQRHEATKAYIKRALGVLGRAIAGDQCRVCEIDVDTAFEYFEQNHIEGYLSADLTIGLISDDVLVSAASFKRLEDQWLLVQHGDAIDMHVENSLSTIVQSFTEEVGGLLLYAVDKRRERTTSYEKIGFVEVGTSEPTEIDGIFNCGYSLMML